MLFSEHNFHDRQERIGSIEVICGSMFSGKTEELIRRLKRAKFAKLPVEIFKPEIDVRYGEHEVVSHDSNAIPSTPVSHSSAILLLSSDTKVVGIDEAQFFDEELPDVCNTLANRGIRVIVAGLDMDYKGRPFGPIPNLMAMAEHVSKVHAVCVQCGSPATYSYRIAENESRVLLGEKESYEPRCRSCYFDLSRKNH
ncbi:thymidine kinase [Sphingobacteruim zhuxiongii]|nr:MULTISPECIES: thymidine kinase [unclassified Sphingobacterium]